MRAQLNSTFKLGNYYKMQPPCLPGGTNCVFVLIRLRGTSRVLHFSEMYLPRVFIAADCAQRRRNNSLGVQTILYTGRRSVFIYAYLGFVEVCLGFVEACLDRGRLDLVEICVDS